MGPGDNKEKERSPITVRAEIEGAPDRTGEGRHLLGPHAVQILTTEHGSLLATRSLIWTEALSRATVFLTVLSGAIISLTLLADATGFGPQTITVALVLLPVVLLLGIAAYGRLVQINTEEILLVMAMNRLRRAYLQLEPGLEPYFTTSQHDDERGLVTTYMIDRPSRHELWIRYAFNTPTIVATVDAALAAAMIVLLLQLAEAPSIGVLAGGGLAFLAMWVVLYGRQLLIVGRLLNQTPRFPTPLEGGS